MPEPPVIVSSPAPPSIVVCSVSVKTPFASSTRIESLPPRVSTWILLKNARGIGRLWSSASGPVAPSLRSTTRIADESFASSSEIWSSPSVPVTKRVSFAILTFGCSAVAAGAATAFMGSCPAGGGSRLGSGNGSAGPTVTGLAGRAGARDRDPLARRQERLLRPLGRCRGREADCGDRPPHTGAERPSELSLWCISFLRSVLVKCCS